MIILENLEKVPYSVGGGSMFAYYLVAQARKTFN